MKTSEKIVDKIQNLDDGITFTYSDLHLSSNEYIAAAKALERLVKSKVIKRASTGLFYKPKKTVFGELRPNEEELIKPYLFEGNQRLAYITGTALYNRMGLTTQVPKSIKIACLNKRIVAQVGNVEIKPAKSYVEVTNQNYLLLELLDVIKDFNKIPDLDPKMTINYLLKKIEVLTEKEIAKLTKAALRYPPRVKALLGALLDQLTYTEYFEKLKKAINPFSSFQYGIKKEYLPTIGTWNIN
jgi:hypothetical protein